jgi:DNA sulfur modification protein DndC
MQQQVTRKMPDKVRDMMNNGALFAVSHSAGKDSQAMYLTLRNMGIPADQIVLIHADLGEVEWPGNVEHIRETAPGHELIIAKPATSFFEMVERRGMWPTPQIRNCTSDLKRGPIEREIRRYLKANPQFGGQVINCMGMRAQESPARAKRPALTYSARNSKAGRVWWDWLPIHNLSTEEVFETIQAAGQKPHPAYELGMSRLSCRFCILASQSDLKISAQANPDLYRKYVETEIRLGHTMNMSKRPLTEITGIPIT